MDVSIQITRTDANLVLINVNTILPTLLSIDLYPKGIGLRVYEKTFDTCLSSSVHVYKADFRKINCKRGQVVPTTDSK